jgi:hypothetical protein
MKHSQNIPPKPLSPGLLLVEPHPDLAGFFLECNLEAVARWVFPFGTQIKEMIVVALEDCARLEGSQCDCRKR